MTVTKSQIKQIHVRMPARLRADKEAKENFVTQYTQDEELRSTKQLTHSQANQMIVDLGGKPDLYDNWALFDKSNKKHMAIMSVCYDLNWIKMQNARPIPNLFKLSEWLKGKSPVKKPLKKMSTTELSKVIYVLQKIAG